MRDDVRFLARGQKFANSYGIRYSLSYLINFLNSSIADWPEGETPFSFAR